MSDIGERLRRFSLARSGELHPNADAAMADEAKAEIERLRAEADLNSRLLTQALELRVEVREESRRLRALVRTMLEVDPCDMAADGVTVLEVWRREARAVLGGQ